MPRATHLKAALQNSSPDARSQGQALRWRGLLSSGRSGLLLLCWGLWVMFWRSHGETMMVREGVGVGWRRGVWERKQKDRGLLKSHKTILESKSHPVAPRWLTDFSFPSYQPKSRASLNGGLQRVAPNYITYATCEPVFAAGSDVWSLRNSLRLPSTGHSQGLLPPGLLGTNSFSHF